MGLAHAVENKFLKRDLRWGMASWLYRHFDEDGVLLYLGVTDDPGRRRVEHERVSSWSAAVASTTIEKFSTRAVALNAERAAVIAECPKFNRVYHRQVRELQVMLVRNELRRMKEGRSLAFDTLAQAKRLRDAGFNERQAEALAFSMRDVAQPVDTTHLATKADLAELKADLFKWIIGLVSGAVTLNVVIVISAMFGLIKLAGHQ